MNDEKLPYQFRGVTERPGTVRKVNVIQLANLFSGDLLKAFQSLGEESRLWRRESAGKSLSCEKSSMQSTDEPSTQARIPRKSIVSELVIGIPRPDTVRVLFIVLSGHSFRPGDLTLLELICIANSHSNRIWNLWAAAGRVYVESFAKISRTSWLRVKTFNLSYKSFHGSLILENTRENCVVH